MPHDLLDLAHAAEARVFHGAGAPQFLVDVMQESLRAGDEVQASRAERALRLIEPCLKGVCKRRI